MKYATTSGTVSTSTPERAHTVSGSHRRIALISTFIALQAWLACLLLFEWGHGVARGVILWGLLAGLLLLRFRPRPVSQAAGAVDAFPRWLRICLALAMIADLGVASYATIRSVRTGEIPLDQGQATWRAARLLCQGEDPYGTGAVVDLTAFQYRNSFREAAGIVPNLPAGTTLDAELQRYDENLDPALRREIMPVPEGARLTQAAAREARLVGYKYGPVPVLFTVPFVWLRLPAIVIILNTVACFGFFAVFWRLLSAAGVGLVFAALGVLAILLDPFRAWNYLDHTATDV